MTSVFPSMPSIATVRRATPSNAVTPVAPIMTMEEYMKKPNTIFFTKKRLHETVKRYDTNRSEDVIEKIWDIPFSVDSTEAVTELTQRLQRVMTLQKIYKQWEIDFNNFNIRAIQETTQADILR
jgi:hypothetical protein